MGNNSYLCANLFHSRPMYKKIIRPLLFELSPELIHRIVVVMLRVVHYVPGARQLLRTCFTVRHPSLEREVFGIQFPNPVGIAAGFDKDAEVYDELLSLGWEELELSPPPQATRERSIAAQSSPASNFFI